jgi:diaminopimelate decarboxylase
MDISTILQLLQTNELPLYVYSKSVLKEQAEKALAFGGPYGLTVRYAMKANPHPEILRQFVDMGLHIDASSEYEAYNALEAGVPADKIALNSQQLPKDISNIVDKGIFFTATSLHQLEQYGVAAPGTAIGVRLNPGDGSGASNRVTTGGKSAGFGIWHEYIQDVHDICSKYSLTISKVHTHIGAGTDPEKWKQVAETTLKLVELFPTATIVSLGGGFKVARMPEGEVSADLTDIGQHISVLLRDFADRTGRQLHLEIEPGTFLTANCGTLVSEVIDVTDTGAEGYNFIRLNTGMNDILRPTLYGAQHPISLVQKTPSADTKDYVVIGHNCESGDILTPAKSDPESLAPRTLPTAQIGDYVLIGGAGAYCASMRARGYNAFPEAKEVFID